MPEFDATERERILEEQRRIWAEPLPENRRSIGCLLLILVPPAILLLPRITPPNWAMFEIIAISVLLCTAIYFTMFGASAHYRELDRRIQQALDTLVQRFGEASADERRGAAVTALAYAHHSEGPSTRATFDFTEQAKRLGPALAYVIAVERVLLEAGVIYPVFTAGEKAATLPS